MIVVFRFMTHHSMYVCGGVCVCVWVGVLWLGLGAHSIQCLTVIIFCNPNL